MDSTELDRIFKEKLSQAECTPPDDLWQGITHKMAVHRRRKIVFRIAGGAVAAAACLTAGLVLFKGEHMTGGMPQVQSSVAEVVAIDGSSEGPDEMADMRSQIEALPVRLAYADGYASSRKVRNEGVLSADDLAHGTQTDAISQEDGSVNTLQDEIVSEGNASDIDVRTDEDVKKVQDFWDAIQREESRTESEGSRLLSVTLSTSSGARLSSVQQPVAAAPSYSPAFFTSMNSPVVEQQGDAHYSLPLTFAVQVGVPVTEKLSIVPAITYSYLETSFNALVKKEKFEGTSRQLHYVGAGLAADYTWLSMGDFLFYTKLGFNAEKCVKSRYVYGSTQMGLNVKGLQWSLLGGVGAEYRIGRHLGIYMDPSLNYYFDNDQPGSIRTDHPFMAGMELGLRFNL